MLLKKVFFLLSFLCGYISFSQVVVYETFEDFKNDKGEKYDDYHGFSGFHSVNLFFLRGKKKHKVRCKDIWGFTYRDALFRVDERNNQPARLVSHGKIFYYENGVAHLSTLKADSYFATSFGFAVYFSNTIDSEVIAFTSNVTMASRRDMKAYIKDNPQYKALFDCIGDDVTYPYTARTCVNSFENNEE